MSGAQDKDEDGYKITRTTLPLVIGVEADATSWLILRASVKQNFLLADYEIEVKGSSGSKGTDLSQVTGTDVAIGATFNFGKLRIDGNLGGLGSGSNTNFFDSSNFFVNAAVTYMY